MKKFYTIVVFVKNTEIYTCTTQSPLRCLAEAASTIEANKHHQELYVYMYNGELGEHKSVVKITHKDITSWTAVQL